MAKRRQKKELAQRARRANEEARRERERIRSTRRRRLVRVAAAAAVVVVVLAVAGLAVRQRSIARRSGFPPELSPGSAAGFHLLVVTLDTTRADHLGCYGAEDAATPVIDGIAEAGLRFADAVTVAPVTLPAHTSLLTGLYPPNHGVRRNGEYRLAGEHVTLAERLRDAGYDTAAFVGAFVLDGRFGLDQGFDVYDDSVTPAASTALSDSFEERPAAAVTDAALAWFRGRDGAAPFFAWVHYFDPHQPYAPPQPYASRFSGRGYDGELAYADAELGRLLDGLRDLDLMERTMVVVTSDHGEGLGQHDEPSHDFFIYDSVMRIPLIVSCPAIFSGPKVVDGAVAAIVDVVPTVLEALALPADPGLDGSSLLEGGRDPDRNVYMESLAPYLDNGWAALFGLRRHDCKYISAPRPEFYDLGADPGEMTNLYDDPRSDEGRALIDRMETELEALLAEWDPLDVVARQAETLDAETRARLAALGYVGGAPPEPDEDLLDPKDMMAVFNRFDEAKVLARRGQIPRSLAILQEVAARAPRSRAVLGEMARLYAMTGHLSEAEGVLRKLVAIRASPEALTLLAQVLIAGGRLDEVEGLAQRALELDPHHGLAYIVRGDLAAEARRFDEAREFYAKAMEVDPYRSGPAVDARMKRLRTLMAQSAGR